MVPLGASDIIQEPALSANDEGSEPEKQCGQSERQAHSLRRQIGC